MKQIHNPILKGFNPDPSILRVGDDYYIATSTFEWFPGVQIHHSKDLAHWRLIGHPLTRISQLDMVGNPDSGGVWAPCLSYDNGVFYLIYTDVKSHLGPFKDTHNYLVTANSIEGPWSDPIYLNSSGFDPSLFHDDDGKKWLINLVWDHRKRNNSFGGILLQQYDEVKQRLTGPIYNVFKGTELGLTEGSHLYKHGGYYYLITAEGGTRRGHAVTVARSESLFGPYTVDPENPMLTSRDNPDLPLQRAGHASLVQTQAGDWYMAYLCGRPLPLSDRCNLGRETAIQKVIWNEDGWLRLAEGGHHPRLVTEAPALPEHRFDDEPAEVDHFDDVSFGIHYGFLRQPPDESWITLTERPGYLRIRGRESLSSMHRQSLIARRQQAFHIEAETAVEFEPDSHQQMAGLIYYYNTKNYYYLRISHDEDHGKTLAILVSDRGRYDEPLEEEVVLGDLEKCYLRMAINGEDFRFYYSRNGNDWRAIGPVLEAGNMSDENVETKREGFLVDQGFTGAFIGLCVQDLSGRRLHADFDYLAYREKS